MKRLLPLLLGLAMILPARASAAESSACGDTVVLLHGLGRSRWSMWLLARRLQREGYHVVNETYPSQRWEIGRIASEWLAPLLQSRCAGATRVHFVTHSMGGIVLRQYLRDHDEPRFGRAVMLAPPNQGSELADLMVRFPPARWVNGPAMAQLTTAPDALVSTLGPVSVPVGVIAGTVSLNPLYSAVVPGPDDGKVAVARCHVAGEADFLETPHSHTWLMNRSACHEQILAFLREGCFRR